MDKSYFHTPVIYDVLQATYGGSLPYSPDSPVLVSVSFDLERDTPNVLSQYAKNFKLKEQNWKLLTGDIEEVSLLLEELEITTVKTPTRFAENNTPIYFIDHTDRVSLIDKEGQVRQSYYGSELNSQKVIRDIQTLLKET